MKYLLIDNCSLLHLISNIKRDADTRIKYYSALEKAQTQNDKSYFIQLIAEVVKESLEKYLSILR